MKSVLANSSVWNFMDHEFERFGNPLETNKHKYCFCKTKKYFYRLFATGTLYFICIRVQKVDSTLSRFLLRCCRQNAFFYWPCSTWESLKYFLSMIRSSKNHWFKLKKWYNPKIIYFILNIRNIFKSTTTWYLFCRCDIMQFWKNHIFKQFWVPDIKLGL